MVGAAAPATTAAACAVSILAGGPLCWCGVGVLALSGHRGNGIEHLGGHVSRKGIYCPGQVWKK